MSEAFTLYKLIVLYMLEKVDFPLTNGQMSEFILEKGYTSYFTLQQAISEMVSAGFIREESTHNRTLYHLTEEGTETIQFFKNNVSPAIRNDVDSFIAEKAYEFSVRCQIQEGDASLIDLTISVPTEEEAISVANNWNQKHQEIYAQIMANLL